MSDNQLPLLRLDHVSKTYAQGKKKETHAVRDVSLTLARGELLGIVGESGCGKSTLAKLVTLLEPVTEGQIWYNGADITGYKPKQRRRLYQKMQIVFQNPYSALSPRMTIGGYMTEALIYHGLMDKREAYVWAREMLDKVGIPESFMERLPHQLSGGQLQRVVIARALTLNPELLILDEPTSALDVSVQKELLQLLSEQLTEQRISCLLIGHDLSVVRSMTSRIAVMKDGSFVEMVPSETLTKEFTHPYTKELLDSVFSIRSFAMTK